MIGHESARPRERKDAYAIIRDGVKGISGAAIERSDRQTVCLLAGERPVNAQSRNKGGVGIVKITGVLLVLLSAFASPLSAAGEFVVGVGDYDYWPHHGVVDHEYRGYAREVLDLFSERSGHVLVYRPLPWKRVIHEYIRGDIDFVFPDNPLWDRDAKEGKDIRYSDAVVAYVDGVVVLPENKGLGLSHLKTLGTLRGFTVWDNNEHVQSGKIKLAESDDFVPLLKQVLMKRVDGAFIELAVANYYLREVMKKPGALVFDSELPHKEDSYYFSTIKHPEIIKMFNEFQIAEQNAIERLQEKYKVGAFARQPHSAEGAE